MTTFTSQNLETFLPVYDMIPEEWPEARQALVEQLKAISNSVNFREIALFIDDEILTGGQFIPTAQMLSNTSSNSQQFRSIFRKVIDCSPLVAGVNAPIPHGIAFDITMRFTLIHLWVSGTDTGTLTARTISGNDVLMTSTDLVITSPQAFDRAFAVIEYCLEV